MATFSGSRKRQARLAFTPLPSSSPAAKGYPKQIAERAAAVRYDGSPSPVKRRKLQVSEEKTTLGIAQLDEANGGHLMPTPAASVEHTIAMVEEEDDDEPVASTQRRLSTLTSRRKQSRQQRLDFSEASTSPRPQASLNMSSPLEPQSSARPGFMGTQTQRSIMELSSDDTEGSDVLPSPRKLKTRQDEARKLSKKNIVSDSKGTRSLKGKRITRSSQKPQRAEDDSAEDEIAVSSSKAPLQQHASEEEDEEDMPTTTGTQRRRRGRQARESSFISSSPPRAIDSDDDLEIVEKPARRRSSEESDEDEDEETAPVTPRRKRLKPKRKLTQQEQDELNEDLDFLGPSSDVEEARAPRNTQSAANTARQKALEKLKRKRSGQATDPVEIVDDEDGTLGRPDAEYDEVYDESEDEPVPPPTSSRAMFHANDEDDDFLAEEEDDEGVLGVPTGIPLMYTRYASMKPKELFKYAIEWMVQKKINPAFQMDDEIYDLTFRKLDDEVKGLAGSKFTSAAWTPAFTRQLQTRPEIAFDEIDRHSAEHYMRDICDACNRTGHPATYQVQFQGRPYNKVTLEEVAAQADEDEDEDESDSEAENDDTEDDRVAYDAQGREVAPANTIYYVGRFCFANAKTSHALNHWRFHLNEWVVTWLIGHGYNTPARLVERDKMSTKKRRKEANKIADRMEKEGVIKTLYKEYRTAIDDAVNSKQGRYIIDSP